MAEMEQTLEIRKIMETLKDSPIGSVKEGSEPELVDQVVKSIRKDQSVSPLQVQAQIYTEELAK